MTQPLKLISWNVNGLRAIAKKNFFQFVKLSHPDILALQEIKADESQLKEGFDIAGYYRYLSCSIIRKGYSGVAVYSKEQPISTSFLDDEKLNSEGRALILEYKSFFLINGYFPNSQEAGKRLDYKLSFLSHISKKIKELKERGKHVIVCGDYNIAHKPIDLSDPESNVMSPGYLKEEREWMDSYLTHDKMIDTFRYLYPHQKGVYSWWSYRTRGRERNVGWRIDYFCINEEAKIGIKDASILKGILGSDHCPIQLIWQAP